MTDPAKIIGFLDVFGTWDPSLAFVMMGAIAVGFVAFAIAKKRTTTILGGALRLPTASHIDKRLIIGSTVFGIGWGLAGFCPGPALVSMASGQIQALWFVSAMVVGMLAFEALERGVGCQRLNRAMQSITRINIGIPQYGIDRS